MADLKNPENHLPHRGCTICDLVFKEEGVLPEHEPPSHVALVEVLHLLQVVGGVHKAQDHGAHDGEAETDEEDVDLLFVNVRPEIISSDVGLDFCKSVNFMETLVFYYRTRQIDKYKTGL